MKKIEAPHVFIILQLVLLLQIRTSEESDERGHIVVREFEDFEWLDHCLKTQIDISGVIVRCACICFRF